jgi:hypothetical protein
MRLSLVLVEAGPMIDDLRRIAEEMGEVSYEAGCLAVVLAALAVFVFAMLIVTVLIRIMAAVLL